MAEDKKDARLLVYVPRLETDSDKKFIGKLLGRFDKGIRDRIVFIQIDGIVEGLPINHVMHMVAAKGLLNYERYRKGFFKGEFGEDNMNDLIDLLKTIASNPGSITSAEFVNQLLAMTAFIKIKKYDFNDISEWSKTQRYIAISA